jgi:DNA-directed RNA polymerase subunit M/transcription elongation factor TFIIS
MYFCPKCKSSDILIERRINGFATCRLCGHKDKTKTFLYIVKPDIGKNSVMVKTFNDNEQEDKCQEK